MFITDDLFALYLSGKTTSPESNGRLCAGGTSATDDDTDLARWWAAYIGGQDVATGRTLDAAVRLAADVCRGAR